MSRDTALKFLQFFLILFVGIAADQWSKMVAEDRLASSRPGHFEQHIVLEVPESYDGKPLKDYLSEEFSRNSSEEIDRMARAFVRTPEGARVQGSATLKKGQKLHVTRREIVVVDGYWDFQYTRNPGAAFGFLADSNEEYRRPFFIIISIVALFIILYLLKGVSRKQQILIWGLSLIASGAVGNFIDRIRFGYVIDFILWKYTDAHRWPTFNIADALICLGVALMAIEIIRDGLAQRKLEKQQADSPSEDAA